jgi:hypothetical protein
VTYLARAENLKLNLRKSKGNATVSRSTNRLRDGIIILAGCCWLGSIAAQLIWHILGIFLEPQSDKEVLSLIPCIAHSIRDRSSDIACYGQATEMLPKFLLFGLLAFWWHPKLLQASRSRGSLSKQKDYYALQLVFLVLRIGGYLFMTRNGIHNYVNSRPIHGFMAMFIAIVSLLCLLHRVSLTSIFQVHSVIPLDSQVPETSCHGRFSTQIG